MVFFYQRSQIPRVRIPEKASYKIYIKRFPNGKLLNDAKVELENLGKSPEEILSSKNIK